jgi:hypothetical protein
MMGRVNLLVFSPATPPNPFGRAADPQKTGQVTLFIFGIREAQT